MPAPSITMTLLVRNEQDIIADNIRFHHAQGVDRFIVMDNLSDDATADIVKELTSEIEIEYIFQPQDDYSQWQWVTEMAQRAATKHNADWVINNDADEFWVAQGGDLKAVLAAVPAQTGVLEVLRHNAVIFADRDSPASRQGRPEFSNVFEQCSLNALGKNLPGKILHRACPTAILAQGNHKVENVSGDTETAGERLKILHYPYRGLDQYKEKVRVGGAAYARNTTLSPNMGITWREHHANLDTGGVDSFWSELSVSKSDVHHGLKTGQLFRDPTVMNFIAGQDNADVQMAVDDLIDRTTARVKAFCTENETLLNKLPPERQTRHPHAYNLKFGLNGAQAHLRQLKALTNPPDPKALCAALPALRDAFSLFPSNPEFKPFLAGLLEKMRPVDVAALREDCAGKRVILHTSCQPRLADTAETIASFDGMDLERYHHVVLIGEEQPIDENDLGLSFDYDGHFLKVPTPDSYEHLHRKLFYAYMLFDLLAAPEMVIKVDDNILLEDADTFVTTLDRVTDEAAAYAGRTVGTQMHHDQWHGWHVDKCADPVVETRGYQYPLPREYASGGYGYILGSEGLAACSYMYLTMKEFFGLRSVGLEDVCVGHAAFAKKLELLDLSWRAPGNPRVLLALPGLVTKESLEREAELKAKDSTKSGLDNAAIRPFGT